MKKTPAFMTGETQQTPPPSRFTPLAVQMKARLAPTSVSSSTGGSRIDVSSTPMRAPANLSRSRLASKKSMSTMERARQNEEDTPRGLRDESMGTKMARISQNVTMDTTGSVEDQVQLLNVHTAQIAELQHQVVELSNANKRLTEIGKQQTASIQELSALVLDHKNALQKVDTFATMLGSLVPAPVSLTYSRPSANTAIVSWGTHTLPLALQKYELSLNGVPSGSVSARNKSAFLSPIEPGQEYRISVQSISQFDDIRSVKADLIIPRLEDEERKAATTMDDESMGEPPTS